MTWLYAFLLTVAIELPIVALLAGRDRRRRGAMDSIGANLFTHPLAWFLIRSMEAPWLAIEIGVFVVECMIYRHVTRMSWRRAVTAALLANSSTAALSFMV
ncbi:MAG: hypothetical protein ACI89X_000631 [Planctomycetota bacterium]|jgi:hypothetical protein